MCGSLLDSSAVEWLNKVNSKGSKHNKDSLDIGDLQQVSNQTGQPVVDGGILLEEHSMLYSSTAAALERHPNR